MALQCRHAGDRSPRGGRLLRGGRAHGQVGGAVAAPLGTAGARSVMPAVDVRLARELVGVVEPRRGSHDGYGWGGPRRLVSSVRWREPSDARPQVGSFARGSWRVAGHPGVVKASRDPNVPHLAKTVD